MKFWGDDISVLWADGNWRDFMPTLGAPLNDVLNSLTRFVIALCVLCRKPMYNYAMPH